MDVVEETILEAELERARLVEAFQLKDVTCFGGHLLLASAVELGRMDRRECGNHVTCTEGDFQACEACKRRVLDQRTKSGCSSHFQQSRFVACALVVGFCTP